MIVDTGKVLREADGPEESDSTKKSASGGKVFAPGCARESVPEKPAGSQKNTSVKAQVTTCSDSPSDAMLLWIKEVENVESLDELKSSRSVCGKDFPNFEMLDAKIASALNRIIQNSQFKKMVSLEEQKAQKEDRFV